MKKFILLGVSSLFIFPFSLTAQASDSIFALNDKKIDEKGFVGGSSLSVQLKNLWIDSDNREHNDYSGQVNEWGQGFIAQYESGFTQGNIGFGINAIGLLGIRLDDGGRVGKSGIDRTPGNIFPTKSNGKAENQFASFGVAPKIRISNSTITYGTMMPKLPIVGTNSERLLPQTYDGGMITVNELKNFTFIGGKLERVKDVNSTDRNTLAVDGAAKGIGSNKFYFAGMDFNVSSSLMLQYYYANLKDFYVQHFLGLNQNWKLPQDTGNLKIDLRYFYSDSDGKNSTESGRRQGYSIKGYNNDGEVDSKVLSGLLTYGLNQHQILAGYQVVSGNSNFPFVTQVSSQGASVATAYLFTNSQIGKFLSAGERTWMLGYSYSFARFGLSGLSTSVKYLKGDHVKTSVGRRGEWERDFILSYKIQGGIFKNVEFSWRNASLRSHVPNVKDTDRNRFIITYDFKF